MPQGVALSARGVAANEVAKRYRQGQIFGSLPYTNSGAGSAVDASLNSVSNSTYNGEHGSVRRSYLSCYSNRSGTHCNTVYYWESVKRPNFGSGTEFVYSVLVQPGKRDTFHMPYLDYGSATIPTEPVPQSSGDYMLCSQQRVTTSNGGFYNIYDIRGYRGVGPGLDGDHSPWRRYSISTTY